MQLVMCEYILQWVEDNINSGSGITAVATLTGYSRRTIELWFSKQYGISLGSYLFRRRMTRAGVLLKLTNLSITEIALYLHYSSNQNFARAFRNFSGVTPSYYRNTKGWDMSIMQASLLLNKYVVYDKSICYLPERYLAGKQYFFKDSIVQSDKSEKKLHIKYIVIDLIKSGKKEIYLSGIGCPSKNMIKSRSGEVLSLIFLGWLVNSKNENSIFLNGGKFFCYRFYCKWQDYYTYTNILFIRILSESNMFYTGEQCYVNFIGDYNKIEDQVECVFYIPVR